MRGTTLILALSLAVVGCNPATKAGSDAGPTHDAGVVEMVDAAPIPPPAILATNQGDIARFPDETPIVPATRATFQRAASPREAPDGKIVVTLPKGTTTTQIAKRGTSVLILFDNPNGAGTQLMGWVHLDAYNVSLTDGGATDGAAPDAGSVEMDAGAEPTPDVVAALAGNKCPGAFLFVTKTGKCHRPCPKGPEGAECKNNPFYCLRCDKDQKRVCTESRTQCPQ